MLPESFNDLVCDWEQAWVLQLLVESVAGNKLNRISYFCDLSVVLDSSIALGDDEIIV